MNFFNSAYKGIPPWDIGRPQKEFIRLAEELNRCTGTVGTTGISDEACKSGLAGDIMKQEATQRVGW